jgi:fructose-1,6-bisphosphatase I
MEEILEAIKRSAIRIREAIAYDDTGYAENSNSTGDIQLKLDIKSDFIIEEELSGISSVKALASEEKESVDIFNPDGIYLIGYDPLDGSSLIDTNLSVGSIFGIYIDDFAGPNLIASVYVVYGPRVELVTATEDGVELFRLNQKNEWQFIQTIHLGKKGMLNACGGTQAKWHFYHKALMDTLFSEGYRLRYSGGMVPDLHQILIKGGGLFSYPGTLDKPKGKLRMVFEVFPFAFVYEKAGGRATNGHVRLLDLDSEHHHDTSPCFFGSDYEMDKVAEVYSKAI